MRKTHLLAIFYLFGAWLTSSSSMAAGTQHFPKAGVDGFRLQSFFNNKCIDLDANGSNNVQMWDCIGSNNQHWRMDNVTKQIRSHFSGDQMCLETTGSFGNAQMAVCNVNANSQKWELISDGRIRELQHGQCLDIRGFDNNNGASVMMWDCANSDNQKWKKPLIGFQLQTEFNQKCLDMNAHNENVQAWDCNGTAAQRWNYDQTTKQVRSDSSLKCLEAAPNSGDAYMTNCHGNQSQKWQRLDTGHIQNIGTTQCLDIRGFNNNHGADVMMWDCADSSNQRWYPMQYESEPEDMTTYINNKLDNQLDNMVEAYSPVWNFHSGQDSKIWPVDIDDMFDRYGHLMKLICTNNNWRLDYNNGVARNFTLHTGPDIVRSSYGIGKRVHGGIDLRYYLYYPYNIGSIWTNSYDHEGDWEGVKIKLKAVKTLAGQYYMKPVILVTEAHGNQWINGWDSGEVWKAVDPSQYTDIVHHSVHYNDINEQIFPPRVMVAKDSLGTYPNTNHERGLGSIPGAGDTNRTCTDSNIAPTCDYVGQDQQYRYGSKAILAKKTNGQMRFSWVSNNQEVSWLRNNTQCSNGTQHTDMKNLPGGINRWGDTSNAGGPIGLQKRSFW